MCEGVEGLSLGAGERVEGVKFQSNRKAVLWTGAGSEYISLETISL